jgi:D-alanyl-D-alanine carboxypeptidase
MLKPSDLRGFLLGLLIVAVIAGVVLLRVVGRPPSRLPTVAAPPATTASRGGGQPGDCGTRDWQAAAQANRGSLSELAWAPFGPPETGWATYAPLVAHEIRTACPPDSPGFARDYARWQTRMKLPADGVLKPAEFTPIRDALALRRPFVQATSKGLCPGAPSAAALAPARPDEAYGAKAVQLRAGALSAYRRMVEAARRDGVAQHPPLLAIVSGYRDATEEAARCAEGGCNTLTRAHCSAHRTGLAVDLYLEPARGQDPTSTVEENRRHMAQTAEYRWLVANAATYGFLPYAYEPWHWEWTGEPP